MKARSLKARALAWLAQREQSRIELRRKLMPLAVAEDAAWADDTSRLAVADDAADTANGNSDSDGNGYRNATTVAATARASPAERVDALLDWLEAHRYLSVDRFVESRLHARMPRFGNRRIRQELQQHQAPLSDEAARALRDTEVERALAVRERKFGPLAVQPGEPFQALERAEQARQARFLAGRGFSAESIGLALRRAARSAASVSGSSSDSDD